MISLLCPTRGRPIAASEFLNSVTDTVSGTYEVEVVFYHDDDDPTLSPNFKSGNTWRTKTNHKKVMAVNTIGPRLVMSDYWNKLANIAQGDILGMMADDIRIRTSFWDVLVAQEFETWPDKLIFLFGRDGIQDENLGTHGFVHRRWVETLGHMTTPHFGMDYADTWMNDVARMVGRRVYKENLYTEHMHVSVQKSEPDATSDERIKRGEDVNYPALYDSLYSLRLEESDKLRSVINLDREQSRA